MENSPPGTQTIPSGALPGAFVLLDSVGANAELPSCAWSHCARAELKLTTARVKMIRLTSVFDCCRHFFRGFHSFLISRAQVGWLRVDCHLEDFAGELVVALLVVIGYSGFSILTHGGDFISGKVERFGLWNPSFCHLLTIHIEDGFASSAGLGRVSYELV